MGSPHRDPWYVPTSSPLDESHWCTYKGNEGRTQQGSRGWSSRQGVQGAAIVPDADLTLQRKVVDAFLATSREGDFDALLAMLDPDVVLRADRGAVPAGASMEIRGAPAVAKQFSGRAQSTQPALVNGAAGAVAASGGQLFAVLGFTVRRGKIVEIDVVADPARLRQLDLAVLGD